MLRLVRPMRWPAISMRARSSLVASCSRTVLAKSESEGGVERCVGRWLGETGSVSSRWTVSGVDVGAQAHEDGEPEAVVVGPLVEFDLGNQLGAHPLVIGLVQFGIGQEGGVVYFEGAHGGEDFVDDGEFEAAAYASGVAELAAFVDAEEQGAKGGGAVSLATGVAADDELLGLEGFDLEPMTAAGTGLVGAVGAFGDHAFQTEASGPLEEGLAVGFHVFHQLEAVAGD